MDVFDRHERFTRDEAYTELLKLKSDLAAARMVVAFVDLTILLRKAGFNPDQPRHPRGHRHGGRWKRDPQYTGVKPKDDEPEPETIRLPDRLPDLPGGPLLPDPPHVPKDEPEGTKLKNKTSKRIAHWLGRLRVRLNPGELLLLFKDVPWVGRLLLPEISAYLDEPKTLEELKAGAGIRKAGYHTHPIVEQKASR